MANMLLEKYAKKVQLAESVYAKAHNGEKMDNMKKMVVAKCLDNVNKFLNESLEGLDTAATQRTAMGEYKKFCMALTNVGIPNLIAFDLVAVSPMSAISGNVAYIEYVKGTDKGQSKAGDLTNNIWQLGDVDTNYTGNAVVETVTGSETNISALGFAPIDGTLQANTGTAGAWEDVTVGADGAITITGATKVKYLYDNVVVPQTVLPTLKAKLTNIALEAKARRIAIYYSQMAAFQAKTDYGFSLADGLAEQAVGQLSYEIDTEIVNMLLEAAPTTTEIASFSKTQPVGVALSEHYAAFAAKIEEYKMFIYKKTKKFAPNFMVVASDIMPILTFVPGFQAASISEINGPYFAGSINGIKVFVSPMLEAGDFFLGVNQGAMQASAGVYAPYMPVVPTQLLEMPDGLNQQGWATMYDAKILNADLLVRGAVVA
jgi:hypothetical protein